MITGHSGSLSHRFRGDSAEGSIEKSIGSLNARTATGSLLILILVSLLGWLYLTQASQVTTTGYRIYELESERVRLQEQVEYLVVTDYPPDHPPSGQLAATFGEENLALNSPQQEKIENEAVGTALAGWWEKLVSQFNIWIVVQPGSAMAEGTP